jgi:hypothetical protein
LRPLNIRSHPESFPFLYQFLRPALARNPRRYVLYMTQVFPFFWGQEQPRNFQISPPRNMTAACWKTIANKPE